MAFYSILSDIRETFFEHSPKSWEMHNGKPSQRPSAGRYKSLIAESDDSDDLESSWGRLESALDRVSPKGGNAMIYFFREKDNDPFLSVPVSLSLKTSTRQNEPTERQSRIGAGPGLYGLPYDLKTALDKERELWDLKKQIEEMQSAQPGGIWEQIGQKIISEIDVNSLVNTLVGIVAKVGAKPENNFPQFQVQVPTQPQVIPQHATDTGEDEPDEIEEKTIDLLESLENHMSKKELSEFLGKLKKTVDENPAVLKMIQ